jgi:hypothetical protein
MSGYLVLKVEPVILSFLPDTRLPKSMGRKYIYVLQAGPLPTTVTMHGMKFIALL